MTLGEYLQRFGDNQQFISSNLVVILEKEDGKLYRVDNEKVFNKEYNDYLLESINFNDLLVRHELRIKKV